MTHVTSGEGGPFILGNKNRVRKNGAIPGFLAHQATSKNSLIYLGCNIYQVKRKHGIVLYDCLIKTQHSAKIKIDILSVMSAPCRLGNEFSQSQRVGF